MNCCEMTGNGQSSGGGSVPLIEQNDIVADFDLTDQGNVNLTTGTHSIVSTPETGSRSLLLNVLQEGTTFDLADTIGLRFRAGAGNTQFSTAAATAARIQFPLGRFYRLFDCDSSRDYIFEIYCSLLAIPSAQASPAGLLLGIFRNNTTPSGAAASWKAIKRHNAAGAQALNLVLDAAGQGNSYTNPLPNVAWVDPDIAAPAGGELAGETKCLAMQNGDAALQFLAGNYDTATMDWDDVRFFRQVDSSTTIGTTGAVFKDQQNIVTVAFATGQVTANMQVDVERLVIRSPR